MKRLLTKKQKRALQLCHHDFAGLTQKEAAKIMGISRRSVCDLLSRVKKVLPQYFPIITKLEAKIYHYYMVEGWEVEEIAEYTKLSQEIIYKALQRAQNKRMFFTKAIGRILSYEQFKEDSGEENIDFFIKQKF